MTDQNSFGRLSAEYRAARKGYPKEVYDYLKQLAKGHNLKTLDMGCGTGISTRELRDAGLEVVGLDKESGMVEVAKKDSPSIDFVVASAEKIPFADEEFDIVTAFTAFHWFDNDTAMKEIRRVMKKGGLFFTALKDSVSIAGSAKAQKEYISILKKYVDDRYNSSRDHEPEDVLEANGFYDIEDKEFPIDEHYTVEESLTLIKSLSFWNLVSEETRPQMLADLKSFFESNLIDGLVVRNRSIVVTSGRKS